MNGKPDSVKQGKILVTAQKPYWMVRGTYAYDVATQQSSLIRVEMYDADHPDTKIVIKE